VRIGEEPPCTAATTHRLPDTAGLAALLAAHLAPL
jgi:hypothetical protein